MMTGRDPKQEMLDAHVAYELARWSGPALEESLRLEVEEFLGWTRELTVGAVVTPAQAGAAARATVAGMVLTPTLVDLVVAGSLAAHERLRHDATPVGKVVRRKDYDALVDVVAEMAGVREAVIEELTTSEVYSQLIAHVLYTGIKDYLLTQNVLARKVPGASSLLRLGQSAVSTAAPRLERGIDKQLTAFVAANISDTIHDSRQYLDDALDEDLIRKVSADIWTRLSRRTLADGARMVDDDSVEEGVVATSALLDRVRASAPLLDAVEHSVAQVVEAQADQPLGALLEELGVSADHVVGVVLPLLTPWMEAAVSEGYLEARIRARLEPFYDSWFR